MNGGKTEAGIIFCGLSSECFVCVLLMIVGCPCYDLYMCLRGFYCSAMTTDSLRETFQRLRQLNPITPNLRSNDTQDMSRMSLSFTAQGMMSRVKKS